MQPSSYNFWATRMVLCALKRNLRAASCCKVEVIKGAAGLRLRSFACTSMTCKTPFAACFKAAIAACAAASSVKLNCSTFLPANTDNPAWKACLPKRLAAAIFQYSSVLKASISRSRSTIMRKAGDCTRPAESPGCTLRHSSGDKLKPTK